MAISLRKVGSFGTGRTKASIQVTATKLPRLTPILDDLTAASRQRLKRGSSWWEKRIIHGKDAEKIAAFVGDTRLWSYKPPERYFTVGKDQYTLADEKAATASRVPVKVRGYWLYKGGVYETSDTALKPEDVRALLNVESNKRRLQLEKAYALEAMTQQLDSKAKREKIPQEVKVSVWQRDGGRCVECESKENLEFDHVIPHSMGGSNTERNLQLLCQDCNRRKGASLG